MQLKTVVFPAPFGPIRADDLAAVHREAHVVHRDQPTESAGQVLDAAGSAACRSSCRRCDRLAARRECSDGSRVETRPRGRQIMIRAITNPNTSMRYPGQIRGTAQSRRA